MPRWVCGWSWETEGVFEDDDGADDTFPDAGVGATLQQGAAEEADADAYAGPDVPDGEASADTNDCCMSEKSKDARFWFFVNLHKRRGRISITICKKKTPNQKKKKGGKKAADKGNEEYQA